MDQIYSNIDDILDSKAESINWLNNKSYSSNYKRLAQSWSKLPMYTDKLSLLNFFKMLESTNVMLIISQTGSGKTLITPKLLLKYIYTMNFNGNIVITNPKQLTTRDNAEFSAKISDVELGTIIGYKYKGSNKKFVSDKTRLLYVTDGLILATILNGDYLLSEYIAVIIDEAHERHIQIDLLLRLLKDVILARPEFRLIIMSATINADIFEKYYGSDSNIKFGSMSVSGKTNYPIQQNWLNPTIKINRSNYLDLAVDKCFEIISNNPGNIIVFVPTQNDAINGCLKIKDNCSKLMKTKTFKCDKLYCVEVYSKMHDKNKKIAIDKDLYKTKGYDYKIIFATNVAESSITFDGLIYVIDSGYELANYFDFNDNSYVVTKSYTSQAQIKQRIGRVGRTQSGTAFHLYTLETFNKFKPYPEPNILVVDLTDFMLNLIHHYKTIQNTLIIINQLITIPFIEQIILAICKLAHIKAIKLIDPNIINDNSIDQTSLINQTDSTNSTNTPISNSILPLNYKTINWKSIKLYDKLSSIINGALTEIGINILKFKSSTFNTALSILMSKYMNCQTEIIKLMAIIETTDYKLDQLFIYNIKSKDLAVKYLSKSNVMGSDHLTILNIYNMYWLNNRNKYLNKKIFEHIDKRIHKLTKYANEIKSESYAYMKNKYSILNNEPYDDVNLNILYVLTLAYSYNLLQRESKLIYTSINFVNNSTSEIEYLPFTSEPIKPYLYAICGSLTNVFGKKNFKCISEIPENIIKDLIKYEMFNV